MKNYGNFVMLQTKGLFEENKHNVIEKYEISEYSI